VTTVLSPDADLAAARAVLDAIPPTTADELQAIRGRLDRSPRRRSSLRSRRLQLAVAVGVAAVASAVVAFAPSGGHSSRTALAPPPASAAERVAKAMDIDHAIAHYTVATSFGGLEVSYETWATAAGSVTLAHEGATVVERATTPTSASIWNPERNAVVTASRASEAGGGDGLSLDEVSVGVRNGTVTVTPTTLDGAPALKAAARGGVLLFDAKTLRPLQWWITRASGSPSIVYRFTAFEVLPLDAAHVGLVDLAARHPGARTLNDPPLYDRLEQAATGG